MKCVPDPDGERSESLSRVLEALSDEHRRFLLCHLSRSGGSEPLADLCNEFDEWIGEHTRESRSRIRLELTHKHLPKLEAAGLVDVEDGIVRATEEGERADDVRRRARDALLAEGDDRHGE